MGESIRSMTGFGSGVREKDGLHIHFEIRSVNHRYLKVTSYVPDELSWVQADVEQRIRDEFRRGSLNVAVSLQFTDPSMVYDIDAPLLKKLYEELEAVRKEVAPEEIVRLSDLLPLEGVVRVSPSRMVDPERVRPVIAEALGEAIRELKEMQFREGRHLAGELAGILEAVESEIETIEALTPKACEENRSRYHSRIQELLAGTGVELKSADVLREVAILAEKADITEELGRLKGHLAQFLEILAEGGGVGRRLDFLTQEMFREANTMAAKVNDYELARRVVEVKASVDRLREQSQNIE